MIWWHDSFVALYVCRIRLATGLQLTHNYLGNLQLVSQYLTVLGSLAIALHDNGQAREILRSALTLAKKLNDIPTQIWVLSALSGMCWRHGLSSVLFSQEHGIQLMIVVVRLHGWIKMSQHSLSFDCVTVNSGEVSPGLVAIEHVGIR